MLAPPCITYVSRSILNTEQTILIDLIRISSHMRSHSVACFVDAALVQKQNNNHHRCACWRGTSSAHLHTTER